MKHTYIACPNCNSKIKAKMGENRFAKWIEINCGFCKWDKVIRDTDFDYIQPSSPFFKMIYGYNPNEERADQLKQKEIIKKQREEAREEKLKRTLTPSQVKEVKSIANYRGL